MKDRSIEELRAIAVSMGKPLETLLYDMLKDAMTENAELKKQHEDMTDCRDIASGHRKEVQDRETILLNQQQEFIKYLEDEINKCQSNNFADGVKYGFQLSLSKYKEIIGVEDENTKN